MSGSDGSAWPTAATRDHHAQGAGHNTAAQSDSLATMVEAKWPTPMAGTPAQNGNSAAGNSDFSRKAEELARAMWTKPQAHDVRMRGAGQTSGATGSNAGNRCLATDAALWGTPRASDAEKGGPNMAFGAGGTPLPAQAAQWPMPASRDSKGENSPDHLTNGTGRLHMDQLPNAVAHGWHRPDPETAPHGPPSSDPRHTWRRLRRLVISTHGRAVWRRMAANGGKRRLNPNFVSWLMAWPIGHPSCVCSEMEFSRWLRDMRGALSRLPTASAPWIWAPPKETPKSVQIEMFGG